jgi:ATP/maltotriose-dependent transcriptional regulator MalT/DNA-binding SARP family transcriptional activator
MPNNMTRLAKLTRPKLHNVLARHRLFAQLDAGRERAVIWVGGPPGSGKTALVASYVDAARLHCVWYHVDAGDQDLATFFHYLSRALDTSSRKAPLPVLTPEHLADLPAFTSYYFRQLYARVKAPAVLVFDNYQDVPGQSPLHAVLEQAALESPEGIALIIISREDPPPEYGRLDASDRLTRIEWNDLKLTLAEAAAIAALRFDLDPATLGALYDASNGWAAGLTLALEQMKRLDRPVLNLQGGALESVFNYFAGQILNTAEPEVREFLFRTALLPRTTADMALAISGNTQSARLLEYFFRRRLFTDRRGEQPYSYQYHDLFRAFLLDQLERSRASEEVNALRRDAGAILEATQRHEEAFALYQSASDWESITRLALDQAQTLIGQGRSGTLREWIKSLPQESSVHAPWLSYWHGISLLAFAPDQAVHHLARANAVLEQDGQGSGQIACCTAIILAHLANLSDFRPLPEWVDRLIGLARNVEKRQPLLAELQSNAALVYFCHLCRPRADYYESALQRATELLHSDEIAVNDKVVPACFMLHAMRETGHFISCDEVISLLHPQMASTLVSPGDRAYWYQVLAWTETSRGDRKIASAACRESQAICQAHAVSGPARHMYTHMLLAANAIQGRDLNAAQQHMEEMEVHMRSKGSLPAAWAAWIRSIVAAMRDDWDGAVRFAEEELDILARNGAVFHLYYAHLHHAAGLIGQQRYLAAHQAIEEARAVLVGSSGYRNLADVDLMAAALALAQGARGDFDRCVRAALALLKRTELHACLWYVDQRILPAVLARALERGIEPVQVRDMIRTLALQPPPDARSVWPWKIRISMLGEFELWLDDSPVESSGKPARKLLALLKALACAGSRGITESQLIDWFWPQSEGDAARKALDISLHRLRALLGGTACVKVSDGRIGLDRSHVWIDAWAFEAATQQAGFDDVKSTEETAALYRGSLLPGDGDAVWSVSYREKLRDRFNRLIRTWAEHLEAKQDYAEALRWYTRGLEADDLVEVMYQGMMRCQLSMGRPADTLVTYQRLRRTLTVKLHALPSHESVALAQAASAQ